MAGEDTVSHVMSKTVRTIGANQSVRDALKVMLKHDIGSVVVTRGGDPVGILTERDIVRRLGSEGNIALAEKVERVASTPLVSAGPDTEVWEAFRTMLERKIRRLPIMEKGKLVGIVTERDLFKWVVMVAYEPNIPDSLKGLIKQNP